MKEIIQLGSCSRDHKVPPSLQKSHEEDYPPILLNDKITSGSPGGHRTKWQERWGMLCSTDAQHFLF